jgi:hypothetical protein
MTKGIYHRGPWPEPKARIESLVEKIPIAGCWIFMGSGTDDYGSLKLHGNLGYMAAHHFSYLAYKGPIPKGLCVLHRCDVRRCVNPDHLFLGTHVDNAQDMLIKGRENPHNRLKMRCPQGHEYSYTDPRGWRQCRICQNECLRQWRLRKKESTNA